jgi:hypothetical protein
VKQTELVVQYLSIARLHEHSTRLEIPKIKHAPTSLAASLEEYLNDKDFETNRRQYLAEKEAKKNGGKPTNGVSKPTIDAKPATTTTTTAPSTDRPSLHKSHPSAPLIDFFSSIGDNQQTMGQPQVQQYPQQTGFQQTGFEQPGMQIPQQTVMGFPQQQQHQQQQQAFSPVAGQGTNPFAQMQQPQQMQQPPQQPQLQTQFTGAGFGGYTPQPFSSQNSSLPSIPQNGVSNFSSQQQQQMPTIAEPLQPQQTSTNPFRQSTLPPAAEQKLLSNPSGVTSPSLGRSPTNPFAKHTTGFQPQQPMPTGMSSSPFAPVPSIQMPSSNSPFAPQLDQSSPFAPQQQQQQTTAFVPQQQQPLMPSPTGTNPFARGPSPQNNGSPGGLTVHATGSTNPFRQSAFVNQQTGQGWQNTTGQGTLGGMDLNQVPTQNVFPRPGQQQQQQTGFMG